IETILLPCPESKIDTDKRRLISALIIYDPFTIAFGERAIFLRFAPSEVYRCIGPGRLWLSSASGTLVMFPFRPLTLPHFVIPVLSLIHISEPTRLRRISY